MRQDAIPYDLHSGDCLRCREALTSDFEKVKSSEVAPPGQSGEVRSGHWLEGPRALRSYSVLCVYSEKHRAIQSGLPTGIEPVNMHIQSTIGMSIVKPLDLVL